MVKVALVDTSIFSRRPATALPRISSESPREYTSAVAKKVMPTSRHMSTMRLAWATSVLPHLLKNSPLPPKVPVPKLSTGTLRPERPSCRYSIAVLLGYDWIENWKRCGRGRRLPSRLSSDRFSAQLLRLPARQRFAPDLRIVADIHRECGMEQHVADAARMLELRCEVADFRLDAFALVAGAGLHFHAQHRLLLHAHPGGAAHAGHGVEDRFDLLGLQIALRRAHALGLAPADPQAALRIEIAGVAPAVHDAPGAVGERLANLRQLRRGRSRVIRVRDRGTGHGDFADRSRSSEMRFRPGGDRRIVDADDAHRDRRRRPAHAV